MVKRQLSKVERDLTMKAVAKQKDMLKWYDYQIKYHELMINEGLEMNYKKMLREFMDNKREFDLQKEVAEKTVKEMEKQLREGVEIREKDEDSRSDEAQNTEIEEKKEE